MQNWKVLPYFDLSNNLKRTTMKTKRAKRFEVQYKGEWVATFAFECDAEKFSPDHFEAHINACHSIKEMEEMQRCKIIAK